MIRPRSLVCLAVVLLAGPIRADEVPLASRVESLGLFKNGLAVVKRSVACPGPGTYRIEDVPNPVHGTFWVESAAKVSVTVTSRQIEVPARAGLNTDLQTELAGKNVIIHFRDGTIPVASGVVVDLPREKGDSAWNRTYERPDYRYYYGETGRAALPGGRYLLLSSSNGRTYVDLSMIASLKADGQGETVKRRVPVLILNVEGDKNEPTPVHISYLTKGMAWAPSYRVDLNDSRKLSIEQQAVVKNEMTDVKDAEIQLISGFPSVQFSHVVSPMSMETTWANFFGQLNQRISQGSDLSRNMRQQAVISNSLNNEPALDLSATPTGEGVDLHFQSIGKRTLGEGDSLSLSVAKAQADYERIIEWIVPDTRNAMGHFIQDYERQQDPDKYQDAAWDAVRFKNPLGFAMTTAPAAIYSNGRFNGQRQSFWVNNGEQTTLHITKALSLRTRAIEQEDQAANREVVYIGGRQFRKVGVKGELLVNNHRKEEVKMVVRRQFSGDLLRADGEPRVGLREEGVYSVNRRYEMSWTFPLKSGEEKTLKYEYTVLVAH